MAKVNAIGALLIVDEFDLSGDTQAVGQMSAMRGLLDATGINAAARERIVGLRDGSMAWTSFFNTDAAQEHVALSADMGVARQITFAKGTTLGDPAFGLAGIQGNYDGNRGGDGSLLFNVNGQGNAYGLDVGDMLTAGKRTDTTATNGTSIDKAASTSYGWAMWYHLLSFSGTSVTLKAQDSADNSTFADITGATSGALTGAAAGRLEASSATATVRRYVRLATTGTFSSAVFVVGFTKHQNTYIGV